MRFFTGSVIGLIAVFALVGLAVTYSALRSARAERTSPGTRTDELSLRARIGRYVGPVDPSMALLNRAGSRGDGVLHISVRFSGVGVDTFGERLHRARSHLRRTGAWCGGYTRSFLAMTGRISDGPFVAVQYLPGLAVGSSSVLAYREFQLARRRKQRAKAPYDPPSDPEASPVIADRPDSIRGEKPRLTTRAKIVILSALAPVIIGVGVLPFILLAVPDPHPVKVPGLAGEIAGTYVVRQDGLYKLYPVHCPDHVFPLGRPVVDDPQPQVIVKYRQLDFLSLMGSAATVIRRDTRRAEDRRPGGKGSLSAARERARPR